MFLLEFEERACVVSCDLRDVLFGRGARGLDKFASNLSYLGLIRVRQCGTSDDCSTPCAGRLLTPMASTSLLSRSFPLLISFRLCALWRVALFSLSLSLSLFFFSLSLALFLFFSLKMDSPIANLVQQGTSLRPDMTIQHDDRHDDPEQAIQQTMQVSRSFFLLGGTSDAPPFVCPCPK